MLNINKMFHRQSKKDKEKALRAIWKLSSQKSKDRMMVDSFMYGGLVNFLLSSKLTGTCDDEYARAFDKVCEKIYLRSKGINV